ncbi:Similar to S.cerevisiae protein TFB5 (Component of RNA polymerase II general transcription factor TFIIH) [Malassezia sympodialis ATCC 42132]|uniref:General transcription and DNA repair factor IIH subunit TFB5 n=1 Tax=Malassezia sympodialis (strain ATCC 42132) TaxID=1230383 RepID=A0A1M8ABE0_MALS4|nr:Similar to S.cerevisiae protein TFB5 (Component of RNA polymerase II general transcription factor TFIIH) [Malassezia sympodialis ATCC 42132]
MRAYAGTLITCDVAVKQMILSIDEHMPCIVMDLDETHVLVNTTLVDQLRIMLDAEFEKNTYTLDI